MSIVCATNSSHVAESPDQCLQTWHIPPKNREILMVAKPQQDSVHQTGDGRTPKNSGMCSLVSSRKKSLKDLQSQSVFSCLHLDEWKVSCNALLEKHMDICMSYVKYPIILDNRVNRVVLEMLAL